MRRLGWRWLVIILLALQACAPGPTGTPTPEQPVPPEPPVEPTYTLPPLPPEPSGTPRATRTAELEGIPSEDGTPAPIAPPTPFATAGVVGLQSFHRSGQTFLTWGELPGGDAGERYHVYRSQRPITAENFSQAELLAELPRGSANFLAGRMIDPAGGGWGQRFFLRLTHPGTGQEVPAGQGLFVWTVSRNDLGGEGVGAGYYAVTILLPGGEEILPGGYASAAVSEVVADPLPVDTGPLLGTGTHVMLQYLDLNTWNPTFHAPNRLNSYYGLDPSDPAARHSIQYGFDYVIYDPVCPSRRDPAPVVLVLQDGPPVIRSELIGACAYKIVPMDSGDTAWFGFAEEQDYRQSTLPERENAIANFTEQRILRMVYDLVRQPVGPVAADPQRLYVVGRGSGAGGALALALRYPNVFAAAYVEEPISDYSAMSTERILELTRRWGRRGMGLPVVIRAPGNWAAPLQRYAGTPIWRWQDLNRGLSLLPLPAAPVTVSAMLESELSLWGSQVAPAFTALNNGQHTWGGWISSAEQPIPDWAGLPPNLKPDARGQPFAGFNVIRDESVPGMSGGSLSGSIPPRGAASYNQTILWSSSWLGWDGPPIDTPTVWEMSLCAVSTGEPRSCGSGETQRINITPRRLQRFRIVPGQEYVWVSRRISDGSVSDSGRVIATNAGLVTIRNLLVFPDGIRLHIEPAAGGNDQR